MANRTRISKSDPDTRKMTPEQAQEARRVREFLKLAHERFKIAAEAESENRKDALDDFNFRIGKQWDPDVERKRAAKKKPCVTVNRFPQFVRQVTNEQRQQRPSITVNPVGDGADTQDAEIMEGMIRHIQVQSDAEIAYDTAYEHMVTAGFGYWRILTRYVDDDSFDQEIFIERVPNPFAWYFDPYSVKPDRSDANFCIGVDDISPETYKDQYPNSQMASILDYMSTGDAPPGWFTKDTVRVAEYFYVETTKIKLAKLSDGRIVKGDEVPEGEAPVETRDVIKRNVKWAKINAVEILEERDLQSRYIPVVKLVGDELNVDGKLHVAGLLRHAKGSQSTYNWFITMAVETIAMTPKVKYLAAAGQVENYLRDWEQANVSDSPVLRYDPKSVGDTPVPAPQLQSYEPPVQAISLMIRQSENDMKATTGIYDAALGQPGPDQSGKAILLRQKQSDISTLNFSDNLARALRLTGRILLDMIPRVYDTERMQRIVNPDGTVDQVQLRNSKGPEAAMTPDGETGGMVQ